MSASTKAFTYLIGVCLLVVLGWSVWCPYMRVPDGQRGAGRSVGYRVDVNTADAAELELLPGVGPSIAQNIVKAREGGAVFRGPEDLEAVKFIGPSLVRRVEGWVSYREADGVLGPKKVSVNH